MVKDLGREYRTGGAGFSKDAMNRSKSNRNALRSHQAVDPSAAQLGRTEAVKNPELTEEELNAIMTQIAEKLKKRRKQNLTFLLIISVVLAVTLLIVL